MLTDNANQATADYVPDFREILMTLWRHRILMIMISVISLVLSLAVIWLMPENYKASATIVLEGQAVNLEDFKDVTEGAKFDDLTVQTEVNILGSSALAEQTIQALHLDQNAEFASSANDPREVLMNFAKKLTVAPRGTSRVLEVSFTARDPELAATVVNTLIKNYLEGQVENKNKKLEKLKQWFEGKVAGLKSDVVEKSKKVEEFRNAEGIAIGKNAQELIYQQINDISAQLAPVEVHKFDVQSRIQALQVAAESKSPDAVIDVVKSPLIQNLKVQESTISQQVQSLQAQYGSKHPKLVAARGELSQVRNALRNEIKNIRGSLENEQEAVIAQEALLQERLDALKKQAEDLRGDLITLNGLTVEQDASGKLLDHFLANYENIQSQVSFAQADAVVVSPAVAPVYPARPGKIILLLAAAVFSGSLALATVFALEMMRGGLRNFGDIRKMGQKPLGIILKVADPAQVMRDARNSSYKEAIKRVYMSGLMNEGGKAVLVTSAMPQEGRTTFVMSMGHYLQSLGHRVIVVDADFYRPTLSKMIAKTNTTGLADVLAGKASLQDVIKTAEDGLQILPAGSQAALSPDILRSGKLHQLLDELKRNFTYILIDSGPLLAHTEAGVLSSQVDGVLIVASWITTSRQNLTNMFATLQNISAPILGVVINKVDIEKYKTVTSGSDFLLPKIDKA